MAPNGADLDFFMYIVQHPLLFPIVKLRTLSMFSALNVHEAICAHHNQISVFETRSKPNATTIFLVPIRSSMQAGALQEFSGYGT